MLQVAGGALFALARPEIFLIRLARDLRGIALIGAGNLLNTPTRMR